MWYPIRDPTPFLMDALALLEGILLIGSCLVLVVLGICLWKRIGRKRILFLVCYVLVYVVLSAVGQSQVINHGGRDWCQEWHPKWVLVRQRGFSGRPKAELTPLGCVFWPCLMIDSLVWHPTERIDDY